MAPSASRQVRVRSLFLPTPRWRSRVGWAGFELRCRMNENLIRMFRTTGTLSSSQIARLTPAVEFLELPEAIQSLLVILTACSVFFADVERALLRQT